MNDSRTWPALAALPLLAPPLCWGLFNQKLRWKMVNVYHVPHWERLAAYSAIALSVLALAATLTFATHVVQNAELAPGRRFIWLLWIAVAPPLAVPLYWLVFMRGRDAA